ncbi:MAG: hypothetical protein OEQ53_11410 [Saprospiraceae bacterium]|nr:hypothetical protein [Saprospiraceae bacterium]
MKRLLEINSAKDIPPVYRETPIGRLLEYHNLGRPIDRCEKAEILIGMCMDNRKQLRIPRNFAYVIRTGGANLTNHDFLVSFAIAVGGIRYIVITAHNHCGMANLDPNKKQFIHGLVNNGGWDKIAAEQHYSDNAPVFAIENEIEFALSQAQKLHTLYPKVVVAPMLYNVDDNRLYLIDE